MAALSSYTYTLLPTGHRQFVNERSGRRVEYGYDAIYRLTSETVTHDLQVNGAVSYTHDAVGNRLTRNSSLAGVPTQSSSYDDNDRLTSDGYDLEGNTITSDGKTYRYDFENRLKSVNNGQIAIVYDADGNRASKTVNGITVKFLVDTNNLTGYAQVFEELDAANAVTRVYAYGLDLISQDQPLAGVWTQHFYCYDGHGSVRFLTDAAGTVTDTFDYDAFGILIGRTGTTPNLYQYCGEQFDPDLGFYYLRARYMNTATGRFWTMDSYEGGNNSPLSLHKYIYGSSNPVAFIDPSGQVSLMQMAVTAGISGAIAGITTAAYGYAKGWTAGQIAVASATNAGIAVAATAGFFGLAYALAAGGGSLATGMIAAGLIVGPSSLGLAIGNFTYAMKYGDEVDKAFATVDLVLAVYGSYKLSRGVATIPAREEAFAAAQAERLAALRQGYNGGAAGVVVMNGDPFPGRSTRAGGGSQPVKPEVAAMLDRIEVVLRSATRGKCAEPRAVSNALNSGNPAGAWSSVVTVANGRQLPACSSCKELLRGFGIHDANALDVQPAIFLISTMVPEGGK